MSRSSCLEYNTQDKDKMGILCPSAKVDIMNRKIKAEIMHYVRTRKRMKAFNIDGCKIINDLFDESKD